MSGGGWDLEEIRQRADIVEIVSPHVRLRKAGRRLTGLCPFHQERTPSFTLDPESGLWHCFGCKAGGDLFRFVEMIEKVSFAEAVELLARRLGLPPRQPADGARQRQRERLLALHEEACKFFESQLRADSGKQARGYLRRRGVKRESVEDFGLGYAPESWDALLAHMGRRGFAGEELARAGLAVAREGGGFYDRFRERIIFPIRDAGGQVIAFGGRALSEDQQPKYLNSPETPLFQKGRTLWAFDRARRAMADAERAIVVEGYLDVVACHEAGLRETVATMGTALTSGHVELLRRRVEKLVLAFDSDSAGLAAALRARELFESAFGGGVRVASMPEGADPDAVIRESASGGQAFQDLVAAAVPMVEWELGRILRRAEGREERERLEVLGEAISALARVPAGVEREYYIRWLAEQWGVDSPDRRMAMEAAVRDELARRMTRGRGGARRTQDSSRAGSSVIEPGVGKPAASRVQGMLLAAFLQYGELASRYAPAVEAEDFGGEEERKIFEAIRGLVESRQPVVPQAVLQQLGSEAREALAGLALEEVPPERVEDSVASGVKRLLEARLRRREGVLLRMLEKAATQEEREAIRGELSEVTSRRSELAGQRLVGDW